MTKDILDEEFERKKIMQRLEGFNEQTIKNSIT